MSVLPVYLYGSTILRKKLPPVKEIDDTLIKLIIDMFETMRVANGIGLAANQVGRTERVLVVDVSEIEELKEIAPFALINPEVIEREGGCSMEEGCLSIPDVRDEVERAEFIKVRYRDVNFEECELEAGGLLARVIMHEIDHLDGVLFLDHLTKDKLADHKMELKEIKRGNIETDYPVVPSAEANKK